MKIKQKAKKKRKNILFFVSIATAVLLLTVFFNLSKTLALSDGWAKGIWNNSLLQYISSVWRVVDNPADSPPSIGWLKSSSNIKGPCLKDGDYEVYFQNTDLGENTRFVSGKAWFGIGTEADSGGNCQGDLPSLGWLDFGADPGSLCSGQSDCHAARWHKNGSDDYSGYLDGYAHIESTKENGWVRLRGNNNGEKYAVAMDSRGILSGYAWNSGIETDPSLVGNQGLGWIKMDGLQIAECDISCVPKKLCQGKTFPGSSYTDTDYCNSGSTVVPDLGGGSSFTKWTCTRGCGSKSCEPEIIIPENGQCGSFNGNSICDKNNVPAGKLCASGTPSTPIYTALTATWTCGNECGAKVTCNASAKCGWTETNP